MSVDRSVRVAPLLVLGVLPLLPFQLMAMDAASTLDKVSVVGEKSRSQLDTPAAAISRLGLTPREAPAAVEVLTQERMLSRGIRSSIEALNEAPGVSAANLPSSPGIASMRGFSGGAISLLLDGVRQTASTIVTRDMDAWQFERIEVLKGPASVMYGEGALAGAINLVPKRPQFERNAFSGVFAYGSFDSSRIGLDANLAISDRFAMRAVASQRRVGQDIDDSRGEIAAAALSASWRPNDDLRIDVAFDRQEDDYDTSYWGTPLVPVSIARDPSGLVRDGRNGYVIDGALRNRNYNVENGIQTSESDFLRTRVNWRINDVWSFSNEASVYDAKRRWLNSETYTYNAGTGLLDRGSTRIEHEHSYWVERAALSADTTLGERRNRFSIGAEYSENEFTNPRQFSAVGSVDPFSPVRGTFPAGAGALNVFHSDVKVSSAFVENALDITPRWMLLGGLRYDRIDLERRINSAAPFGQRYTPLSWRVGTTFDVSDNTRLYAQVSEASAPVGSMLILSLANSRFDLTTGRAIDAGVKSSFHDGRVELTLAGYLIRQDDIVTRDPLNPSLSVQGGEQSSRGLELSITARPTDAFRIDASLVALDARFDRLLEAGAVDRAGNTPPNVPELVANLFASYRFEAVPLSLDAGLRHVGRFYTDNANLYRVAERTLFDAAIKYRLPFGELTLRGRNLTDELYAEWAGGASDQFVIGAPRSAELELRVNF